MPWHDHHQAAVRNEQNLVRIARLIRQFHDVTAGTDLTGDAEVAGHNDLSPKNTVYRVSGAALVPVAFLDWDLAAPGARIHDLAHAWLRGRHVAITAPTRTDR